MNKREKKGLVFIVLVAIILSIAYLNRQPPVDEDVTYWLKMQSAAANRNAPVMVDENQRFEGTQAVDDTIVYTFTQINAVKAESDVDLFAKEVTEHLLATACPMEGVGEMFRRGAKIKYRFLDRNSELIFTTTITKELCSKKHN